MIASKSSSSPMPVALRFLTVCAALLLVVFDKGPGLRSAHAQTAPIETSAATPIDPMSRWWSQWNDPVLLELIGAAQARSGTLAQAALRIEQARAAAVAAGAGAQAQINLNAGAQRGTVQVGAGVVTATQVSLSLPSSWELDLFGRVARTREAAQARLQAEQAQQGAVQVALAAETAAAYLQYRFCEVQTLLAQREAGSRQVSASALADAVQAGLAAPAQLALARSGQADAQQRALAQATECQAFLQALGVLTARETSRLQPQLQPGTGRLPSPQDLQVRQVPAALLERRPDVAAAQQAVEAAQADLGAIRAERYPRLSLNGSVGPLLLAVGGGSTTLLTWSIGPALSLPILDGGRRNANEAVALTAYSAAQTRYQETARRAVQEVEEALLRLDAAQARSASVETVKAAQQANRDAVAARKAAGLASMLDLEEAERAVVSSDAAQLALHRDRLAAWLQLYRALGGGWAPDSRKAAEAAQQG